MGQRGRLLPDDEPAQKEAARWSLWLGNAAHSFFRCEKQNLCKVFLPSPAFVTVASGEHTMINFTTIKPKKKQTNTDHLLQTFWETAE